MQITPPPYQGEFTNPTWQQWFYKLYADVKELYSITGGGGGGSGSGLGSDNSLNTTTFYWVNF